MNEEGSKKLTESSFMMYILSPSLFFLLSLVNNFLKKLILE